MNPILEAFLITLLIGVIVFLLGGIIGLFWFAAQRQHEADAASGNELDIPADREFVEMEFTSAVGKSEVGSPTSASARPCRPSCPLHPSVNSAFPADETYDAPIHPLYPKRF
jgi:hypothetical protein